MSDSDLVAAVRRGDDQAFELLYERYHRRIAAYIYGMVSDYGRAEDIAQDVFMSALRRMRETDRAIAFKPWIYEIAKNACIDQFRRSRRTEEVSYDADEGLGAADYGRLVNGAPTPDVAVDQKMSIDHLRGAFGGLSDTHHQILVMRELEGLSYREIGERLGMSRPSVESTLFRARRRLSEEYEDLVSGERCTRVQTIIVAAAEGALGARDQRKLGKHAAHCQSCRRQALLAGVDAELLGRPKAVRARIAAFLPLPAFLRRRVDGDDAGIGSSTATVGHHAPALAHWTAQLSATVDPAIAGWAKAAAAAATIAVAGVGAGAAADDERLNLRSTVPASASTKPLKTERTAAPAATGATTKATGSSSRTAGTAPVAAAPAGPATAPAKSSAGTTSDATRATDPVTPLVGGSGAGSTSSGEDGGTIELPPLGQSDGTDEANAARPDPDATVLSEAGKAVSSLPGAATGATTPGTSSDGGTTRDTLPGAVGETAAAVAGGVQP